MLEWSLAVVGLILAVGPALLFWKNLGEYRVAPTAPPGPAETLPALSILIPARNEALGLQDTLTAALTTTGLDFEIVVLDDHSTDGTPDIVRDCHRRDPRVRLEQAPPLPPGWCGKQHACWVLSQHARFDHWLFLDADVRLAPTGAAEAVRFFQQSQAALISGVPRQETGTLLETLLIPLIHFVLLGFLPIHRMRQSTLPAYGAGCGQFFLTDRRSYERAGGHAAIRESLHDGVRLPRQYRAQGLLTDLFDATPSATCRMYRSNGQVWHGLSKNATEGLAAPAMIVPATLLLLGGQVLPWGLLAWGLVNGHTGLAAVAAIAAIITLAARVLGKFRFQQRWLGVLLHPLAITLFLVLQWTALGRQLLGRPAQWKQRSYTAPQRA